MTLYKISTSPSGVRQIWQYSGTPWVWEQIDENPQIMIIAPSFPQLYQLRRDRSVWQYSGTPGVWEQIDNQPWPYTFCIAAAHDNGLYQIRIGKRNVEEDRWRTILRYTGTPMVWDTIDNDSSSYALWAAPYVGLYQMESSGGIWLYTGPYVPGVPRSGWIALSSPPASSWGLGAAYPDAAFFDGQPQAFLYLDHGSPTISSPDEFWQFTGTAGRWVGIGDGSLSSAGMRAGESKVCSMRYDWSIWQYSGTPGVWEKIDDQPNRNFAVDKYDDSIYKLMWDGSVWQYSGTPMVWEKIDFDPSIDRTASYGLIAG